MKHYMVTYVSMHGTFIPCMETNGKHDCHGSMYGMAWKLHEFGSG